MEQQKPLIKWSAEAIDDLKAIYYNLLLRNSPENALKIRNEIFLAARNIIFPEQFQVDEFYNKYRRIIIRNYKVLYSIDGRIINITSVISSYQDSSKQ